MSVFFMLTWCVCNTKLGPIYVTHDSICLFIRNKWRMCVYASLSNMRSQSFNGMYINIQYIKRYMCVCLFCIVNTIWMPISNLEYNYAILTLLFQTCLNTSGGTQYLAIRRLTAFLTTPLDYLPYYGLAFGPYTLFLYDFIYTTLVYKRTDSISKSFSTFRIGHV